MEKFGNEDLLEPLKLYDERLKDAFHNNAIEYFDNLTKKGGVDVPLNQEHCKNYYHECDLIKDLKKKKALRNFLRVLLILLTIGVFVAGVLLLVNIRKGISDGIGLGIGIPSIFVAIGLIFPIIHISHKISNLKKEIKEHEEKAAKHKADAYETMKGLNSLYEWNMAAGLMSKTTPLIELDPIFISEKFQYLHEKYGYEEYSGSDISSLYVQSGSILGNPFVFEKNYCQSMRDHVYEGTLTITYTVRVSDGKGGSRLETRTQTLVAHYTAPEPYYYLDTWLIYGNEAAPNLSFSRYPTDVNSMNEKQIEKYVSKIDKKLDKMVKDDLMKDDGSFTRLHNEEFEALFNCFDRDNEVEFRLLFTPLGQKNMISLLKGKDVGFGDDFIFKKRKMLNYIKSGHMQGSDSLDKNPDSFIHFDHKVAKELFVNYADKYLKDVYFDLAPLISIPLYQQHKDLNYIYGKGFNRKTTNSEVESAANSHGFNLFKHPNTYSDGVILKSKYQDSEAGGEEYIISAHSFSGTERIEYVPTLGGDGHMHNVPVHWIEYKPIVKETPFIVKDTETDKSGYYSSYNEGKYNNIINRFGNSSAILFKKRLMSFIPKNK
ncbi:MAG: hypothetical protein J6M95_02240 [Bacilli bacterium]|nr:hypothetical protein [Bacilli bacterium]